jgi:hypothetical protein
VRDSDLPLRTAWPLFVVNCINWFTDEDSQYLSSFRTGEVWRVPVRGDLEEASLKLPGGALALVPVHEGRAVYLGRQAGFYELSAKPRRGDAPERIEGTTTAFAANLLDVEESTITPSDTLVVDGKTAGPLEGFHVGVRREIWIYLLVAAALLTALEWATYHRRVTV